MNPGKIILFFSVLFILVSCKIYRQDIMFQADDKTEFASTIEQIERNYQIQKNDYLKINVFTNYGERIIDPNFELSIGGNNQNARLREEFTYLVQQDGMVKLPIVGKVTLEGKDLDEAEEFLEGAYDRFYKDSFVKLQFLNKRVIVLGSLGGQVIPLQNENTSLVEVLALAGGVGFGGKVNNIKIIRNGLNDPVLFQLDISSTDGFKDGLMLIESGDIIYIEPWRRAWLEVLRDISPAMSVISSVITLYIVISRL